ncbi:tryptophan synthase subunit alpha [Flexithrix dorotheae]|uniref:tryptophan synthase subunit alpha n=1 Tax=Flexithrix dorotheae TaxID=70993 RepID=UPI00047744C6|nr:tryptophan synthase subunit alpha [Flexithrix dorotheae]
MNRIDQVFQEKKNILNIYFTAGYPKLGDTVKIIKALEKGGADLIEIGMPYSDPVADGPTIQESNMEALENGMTITKLFEQLEGIRDHTNIPIILMGYINPVIQYGVERFVEKCKAIGIDGTILPDLPLPDFKREYKALFDKAGLYNIFLISPQTSEERIKQIDEASNGFIYMVSSNSITGAKDKIQEGQVEYYERVKSYNLRNKKLIGFGISNNETFTNACAYAEGAIIGSAFIKLLSQSDNLDKDIAEFVKSVKG